MLTRSFVCLALFISFCSFSPLVEQVLKSIEDKPGASYQSDVELIVGGNNQFAFDLYRQFLNRRENVVFSPYSISAALAMTLVGAKGETAQEIQKVLHYPHGLYPIIGSLNQKLITNSGPSEKFPTQLLLANACWVQQDFPLLPAFKNILQTTFNTSAYVVDFNRDPRQATKKINDWVTEQTQGKINKLMMSSDVSSQTRLVLTSAIYMKGKWEHLFDSKNTKKEPFYIAGKKHFIQSSMMHTSAFYPLLVEKDFAMIEIPYVISSNEGPQLAMLIMLPQEELELNRLEKELTWDRWKNSLSQLKSQKVNLVMPKFKLEDRLELNSLLKELGLVNPFTPKADFSGMTGQKDLYISKAVHKTFIQVDEQGTEAAAATGISMNLTAIRETEKPYDFIVNRPFVFCIIDKTTQSILFLGRIIQP